MKTKYENVSQDLLNTILNDFYNYVMDEHDCILRDEEVHLFIHKDCDHPILDQYKDDVGNTFCGICQKCLSD